MGKEPITKIIDDTVISKKDVERTDEYLTDNFDEYVSITSMKEGKVLSQTFIGKIKKGKHDDVINKEVKGLK